MSQEIFKIRRAVVAPLGIAFFSLFALFALSFFLESLPGEKLMLGAVFFPATYFFIEVFSRQALLKDDGIKLKKFLRKKELKWTDITSLGCVVVDSKVYALLTTTKGFYILSNNYERFPDLLEHMGRKIGKDRVEKEVFNLIQHPLKNDKPVRSAWFTATIVAAVMALRIFIF